MASPPKSAPAPSNRSPPDNQSPPSNSNSTSSPSPPSNSNSSSSAPPPNSSPSSPPSPPSNSTSSSSPPPSSSGPSSSPPPPYGQHSSSQPPTSSPPAPPVSQQQGPFSSSNYSRSPPQSSASKSPLPASGNSNSPPSSGGTRNSNGSKSDGGGDGANGKLIAGVVIGAGILAILMIVVLIRRRKKRKREDFYYSDPMKGNPHSYYETSSRYNNAPQRYPDWHKHQGHGGGPRGSQSPPPPPPGMVTNGEDSSGYTGPRAILPPPSPPIALGFNKKSTFTYKELDAATGGFFQANLLGEGGFGRVYKGVLPNGKAIAVKCLKSGSGQGEREFQAEVEIISRVHHRYLVSLEGYCIADGQRMLVYEFVPNNTLEYHLHGKGLPVMDFSTRVKIALESAKGLAYLHEDCHPRIIHRDIKSSNILLDFNFEAKVADFGLAKLTSDEFTHVSTRVMGTFGYLAPEYASSGKLTEKSDVFSFGVMVLELITGKRPVDKSSNATEDGLVDWARPLLTKALDEGNFDEIADPNLNGNYNTQEMTRMVSCAAASIRHSAKKRPKMSQIVRVLEGEVSLDDLNEGVKPGHSSMYSSGGGLDNSQQSYQQDMKKFRQIALSSTEFPSSESNESREMSPPTGQ